jgi:hypothetical protein
MRASKIKYVVVLLLLFFLVAAARAEVPQVKAIAGGESKTNADACRGILVGPGVNQPDPFPGYGGFVG